MKKSPEGLKKLEDLEVGSNVGTVYETSLRGESARMLFIENTLFCKCDGLINTMRRCWKETCVGNPELKQPFFSKEDEHAYRKMIGFQEECSRTGLEKGMEVIFPKEETSADREVSS